MFIIENKLVLVHLPKTAGQWFVHTLKKTGVKTRHVSHHERASKVPEQYADLPQVGFVRDPVDWYRSWLRFHLDMNSPWIQRCGSDHEAFVGAMLSMDENLPKAKIGPFGKINRDLADEQPTGECLLGWLTDRTFDTQDIEILKFEDATTELARLVEDHELVPADRVEHVQDIILNHSPSFNRSRANVPDFATAYPDLVTAIAAAESDYCAQYGY